MSTATLFDESPAAIYPAVANGTPAVDHTWRDHLLRADLYIRKAGEFLNPDGARTATMRELLSVKEALDPASTQPGALLPFVAKQPQALMLQDASGGRHLMHVVLESPVPAALAEQWANANKKNLLTEGIRDFLTAIDTEINDRLTQRQERDRPWLSRLVRTGDFGKSLSVMNVSESVEQKYRPATMTDWWVVGRLDGLAQDHHARTWAEPVAFDWGGPSLVLGPCKPALFVAGGPGSARAFYDATVCWAATKAARVAQLQQRLERPIHDITPNEHAKISAALEAVRGTKPPKLPELRMPALPSLGWAEDATEALSVFRSLGNLFRMPLSRERLALEDLLLVRSLFHLEEEAPDPGLYAGVQWSGQFAGEARRADLVDILRRLVAVVDQALVGKLEAGLLAAAELVER